jgi:hypothetical protein
VMTMSVVASVSTVGSKKVPPCGTRVPPVITLAPFFIVLAMCASTLLDRLHIDEQPDHRTRLEPGDLHRAGGLGETLRGGVIDAVLHQDESKGRRTEDWELPT